MIKVLFVEDDEACAYAIQGGLELLELYDVRWAANGKEALAMYDVFCPDVVVSDVEMPEMNGFELANAIRAKDQNVLILLASGLTSPKDLREGYKLEIDEYVKKPYIAEELHHRIQAILRRTRGTIRAVSLSEELPAHTLSIGNYHFNLEKQTLSINDKEVQKLSSREAEILLLLHDNRNHLVNRSEFLQRFWANEDPEFASRSLDVFISKLRKYLSEDPYVKIVNERGRGLRLEVS